jgi:hypothetical protein
MGLFLIAGVRRKRAEVRENRAKPAPNCSENGAPAALPGSAKPHAGLRQIQMQWPDCNHAGKRVAAR